MPRRGQKEDRNDGKRGEDEAMEGMGEEGEEEREKERNREGVKEGKDEGEERAGVPEKENKCIEERKRGGRALSISLLLGYRRSQETFGAHLNFREDGPPFQAPSAYSQTQKYTKNKLHFSTNKRLT